MGQAPPPTAGGGDPSSTMDMSLGKFKSVMFTPRSLASEARKAVRERNGNAVQNPLRIGDAVTRRY